MAACPNCGCPCGQRPCPTCGFPLLLRGVRQLRQLRQLRQRGSVGGREDASQPGNDRQLSAKLDLRRPSSS
jgi:hypothetical protein